MAYNTVHAWSENEIYAARQGAEWVRQQHLLPCQYDIHLFSVALHR